MAPMDTAAGVTEGVAKTFKKVPRREEQPTNSLLLCHICGATATTGPGSTGRRTKAGDLPRIRKCQNGHVVRTIERVVGLSVEQVLVRLRMPDDEIRGEIAKDEAAGKAGNRYRVWKYEEFSVEHLARRLHHQLFGILEQDECLAIAEAVSADLAFRLVSPVGQKFHRRQKNHPEQEKTPRMLGLLAKPTGPDELRHFITLEQIRDFVLNHLSSVGRGGHGGGGSARFRAAHVVYALSTHGRIEPKKLKFEGKEAAVDHLVEPANVEKNHGWKDAAAFLKWFEGFYDDLQPTAPVVRHGRPMDDWWRPVSDPPTIPQHVVKRHKKIRRRGTTDPFINARFENGDLVLARAEDLDERRQSMAEDVENLEVQAVGLLAEIKRLRDENAGLQADLDARAGMAAIVPALAGVPYEPFIMDKLVKAVAGAVEGRNLDDEGAENVVAWVLWSLIGQEVVLSSQLGAAVADCLRKVDDIAYLKWVIVAKELRVTSIQREAAGLMNYPSTKLIFTRPSIRAALAATAPDEYLDEDGDSASAD